MAEDKTTALRAFLDWYLGVYSGKAERDELRSGIIAEIKEDKYVNPTPTRETTLSALTLVAALIDEANYQYRDKTPEAVPEPLEPGQSRVTAQVVIQGILDVEGILGPDGLYLDMEDLKAAATRAINNDPPGSMRLISIMQTDKAEEPPKA